MRWLSVLVPSGRMWSWPTGRGMSGGEEVLSGILKCRENSVFASGSPYRGFCAILVVVCVFNMSCFSMFLFYFVLRFTCACFCLSCGVSF